MSNFSNIYNKTSTDWQYYFLRFPHFTTTAMSFRVSPPEGLRSLFSHKYILTLKAISIAQNLNCTIFWIFAFPRLDLWVFYISHCVMDSNASNLRRKVLGTAVGAILQETGFDSAEEAAFETLTNVMQSCKHLLN